VPSPEESTKVLAVLELLGIRSTEQAGVAFWADPRVHDLRTHHPSGRSGASTLAMQLRGELRVERGSRN
jgi:hypothetical protein